MFGLGRCCTGWHGQTRLPVDLCMGKPNRISTVHATASRFTLHASRLMLALVVVFSAADVSTARFLSQKQARKSLRIRMGRYANTRHLPDPQRLGKHSRGFSLSERNGIVYTCKGGHIDIAHLRKAADCTASLATRTLAQLTQGQPEFSFKLREPSRYFVRLTYPADWNDLPAQRKQQIARQVAIGLGQYYAHTALTWHEILTWFGYKCTGFWPEAQSAFAWDDTYSNLLGVHLGGEALRDTEHDFNEAMTLALDRELAKLGVQSRDIAKRSAQMLKDVWYSKDDKIMRGERKRSFDIGLGDGLVTPWLVPNLSECAGAQPQPYPVPSLALLAEHGFSIKFEIEPREWERDDILKAAYPDSETPAKRIRPALHFPLIMDYIKADAAAKYGPNIGRPSSK